MAEAPLRIEVYKRGKVGTVSSGDLQSQGAIRRISQVNVASGGMCLTAPGDCRSLSPTLALLYTLIIR